MTLRVHPDEIVAASPDGVLAIHHSWERVRLGHVADVLNGAAFASSSFGPVGDMPLIRIRDVGKEDTQTWYSGPYDDIYVVEPGSLIVGMDGEFRVDRWRGARALLNQRVCKLTVREPAVYSERFLRWTLPGYSNAVNRETSSVTVKHLSSATVKELPIPLPPVREQERIVAAIEEQFSRLDAGVAALRRARQNLTRMRAAVLQAAVTGQLVPHSRNEDVAGMLKDIAQQRRTTWASASAKPYREPADPGSFPLSVPEHWRIASLESLTSPTRVICYGILMPKEDVRDGVPYVRVKDMKGWSIDLAGLKRTSPEIAANYARASLETNDLLLAIRGSYGRVAIVPPALSGGNITQDSARIAAHKLIDHRYLLYYLGGSVANRYYQRVARGVAVKGVNIGDLRTMPVPVPPREEQAAIAEEVERQFTVLDQIEKAVQVNLRLAATLRSSVLAAAFSGALVQQNPDDEPAAVTLERIAAKHTSCNGRKSSHNATRRIKGY